MKDEINEICKKIFEKKESAILSDNEMELFKKSLFRKISDEYWIVLQNYSNIYIREDYGFKGIEKSPMALKNGYERINKFIGTKGKENIEYIMKLYQEQLPRNFFPIALKDGGNLLCVDKNTGYIYIWLHDRNENESQYLVEKSFALFMDKFEKIVQEEQESNGIISCELSDDFFDYL